MEDAERRKAIDIKAIANAAVVASAALVALPLKLGGRRQGRRGGFAQTGPRRRRVGVPAEAGTNRLLTNTVAQRSRHPLGTPRRHPLVPALRQWRQNSPTTARERHRWLLLPLSARPSARGRNQPRRPRRKRRRQPRDFEPRSAKAPATQRPRTTPVTVLRSYPTPPHAEDDFVTVVRSYAAAVRANLLAGSTADPGPLRPTPAPRRSLLPPSSSSRTSPPAAPPAEPAEDPRDALITTLLAALRAVSEYLPSDHPMRSVCQQAASAQSGATAVD
ncbi:hypothetical protein MTO96_038034 [Rhipicephalus appendiculatus]